MITCKGWHINSMQAPTHSHAHTLLSSSIMHVCTQNLLCSYTHTHTHIHTHTLIDYRSAIKPLPLVKPNHGLRLKALVDIDADESGVARKTGEEWLLKGPATYIPRPDVVRKNFNSKGNIIMWPLYSCHLFSCILINFEFVLKCCSFFSRVFLHLSSFFYVPC